MSNTYQLIKTLNNPSLPLTDRIGAATRLWEIQSKLNKSLKSFKSELSNLSEREGEDLRITSTDGRYVATVERQPPTPKVESLDIEALKAEIGDDLFERYIAHSYTIRWSDFKLAPQELKDRFLQTLDTVQTYQVKFKRTPTMD
jgi:hypothetical protein